MNLKQWLKRRRVIALARLTWRHLDEHELLTRASAIAFSALTAAVPLLVLVVTICAHLLPDVTGAGGPGVGNLTAAQLQAALHGLLPAQIYGVVAAELAHLQEQPPAGIISISLAVTLWTASNVFVDIIDALNRIYGLTEIRPYWHRRLLAIGIAITQSILVFVSLVLVLVWPYAAAWLGADLVPAAIAWILKFILLLIAVATSYSLLFKMGPVTPARQRWITPGSIFGTVVLLIAGWLFRLYMQNFATYDRLYGSLGGLMALLFWFWISSVVLLAAAEMNRLVEDAKHPEQLQEPVDDEQAKTGGHLDQ